MTMLWLAYQNDLLIHFSFIFGAFGGKGKQRYNIMPSFKSLIVIEFTFIFNKFNLTNIQPVASTLLKHLSMLYSFIYVIQTTLVTFSLLDVAHSIRA